MYLSANSEIVRTKLFIPPLRCDLIPRPRLVERIQEGITQKLVLVSAPAGYGKTTLLVEWVQQADIPVAWLSLDRTENDPYTFLSHLIACIQTMYPDLGGSMLAAVDTAGLPQVNSLVAYLINEMTEKCGPLVIIFDDFHQIQNEKVIDLLCYFIDHQPPQVHLLVASRADLPSLCSRLRACGEATIIDNDALRFTNEETHSFLHNALGSRITREEIDILDSRTEGWIAAIQMAAIALRSEQSTAAYVNSFSGSDRHINDYLINEVVLRQPPEIQQFLLKTSILNELNADLCNAVLNIHNSQEILERLERMGMFVIPLDHKRVWYRYHHLFAELLSNQLKNTYPEETINLHQIASDWYKNRGMVDDAIDHALAIGEYDLVMDWISGLFEDIYAKGKFNTFLGWIDRIPPEYTGRNPALLILQVLSLFEMGKLSAFKNRLALAEQLVREKVTDGLDSEESLLALQGFLATVKGVIHVGLGEVEPALACADMAYRCLPQNQTLWRILCLMIFGLCHRLLGDYQQAIEDFTSAMHQNLEAGYVYMSFITINIVSKLNAENGKLETAMRVSQKALDLEAQLGYKTPLSGFTYLLLSDLLYQSGDAEKAEVFLNRGKDLVILHGDVYCTMRVYFTMARIKLAMGKRSQAVDIMKEMNYVLQDLVPTRNAQKIADAYEAFICVYADRLAQAKRWLSKSRYDDIVGDGFLDLTANQYMGIYRPTQDLASHLRNFLHMTAVRVLLADGAANEALEMINQVLAQLEIDDRNDQKIEALTLQALALRDLRRMDDALSSCYEALCLAVPEGYLQFFLLLGRGIQGLLVMLKRQKLQQSAVLSSEERVVLKFTDVIINRITLGYRTRKTSRKGMQDISAQVDFSQREVEVLQWLSRGLSYAEIASKLIISENTLRTYIKRVYYKLEVNNRLQAVNKAKDLEIL